MKAIFMSSAESKSNINRIYSQKIRQFIKESTFLAESIFDKKDIIDKRAEGIELIFSTWGMPVFSKKEIELHLPDLKAVFYAAGSVKHFALPFLLNDVKVTSAQAANAVPVAEYTVSQILLANKGYYQNTMLAKKDQGSARKQFSGFPGNFKTRIGILGAGMIGRKVIEFLKPYEIEILVYDPFLTDQAAKELGVQKCPLYEVFSACQTISNHMANVEQTQGILDYECFGRMCANATFINTGRGAQVAEKDLIKALTEEPGRTALLDVTWPEPPDEDSLLYKLENVFLTTHIAGSSGKEVERMGEYMADELKRFLAKEKLRYEVTCNMLETMA